MLIDVIEASAIMLTKPTEPVGKPGCPKPVIMLPIAPGTAMIVPKPAAVATARCMLTPLIVMISTAGVPPPMPSSDENAPSPEPSAARAEPLRHVLFRLHLAAKDLEHEIQAQRDQAHSENDLQLAAIHESWSARRPPITPPTTQGSHPFRMFQSTAPRLACA